MTKHTNWNQLAEEHEIAYLRGDLATSQPGSYTLEEMREISVGMDASTARIEAAMREDFQSWPPRAQAMMLDLLQRADPGNFSWWLETLVGKTPDAPPAE